MIVSAMTDFGILLLLDEFECECSTCSIEKSETKSTVWKSQLCILIASDSFVVLQRTVVETMDIVRSEMTSVSERLPSSFFVSICPQMHRSKPM